jgi:hypothetical protein
MGGELDPETNQQSSGAPRKSRSLRFTNHQGAENSRHPKTNRRESPQRPKNPQTSNLTAESRPGLSRNQAGDGVHRGQGKIRSSLNGRRHGLTGQVLTMAEEDREAFEKFALLSLYEQRISRKVLKNEERLRAFETERKATPKPQMASVVRMPNPTPPTPQTPTNSASETSKSGTPQ